MTMSASAIQATGIVNLLPQNEQTVAFFANFPPHSGQVFIPLPSTTPR